MNPATPGPRTVRPAGVPAYYLGRPAGAPAYYLGRPASVWIAAARRRRNAPAASAAAGPDGVSQLARISPSPRRSAA